MITRTLSIPSLYVPEQEQIVAYYSVQRLIRVNRIPSPQGLVLYTKALLTFRGFQIC